MYKPFGKARTCLVVGLSFGLCLASATGAESGYTSADTSSTRPRIGLVLAGGGAKGGAHVGVLKVLEEYQVPIDCIAGTSIGALVGAGYASGIPAAKLEKFVVGIDWKSVVGGVGQRDLKTIEQKRAGVTYSNNIEMGIKDGGVTFPGGLVNTSGIEDLLRSFVAQSRMQPDFDRLPIPYRAVATDMITGEMVVLDSGDLATAMRASMAIPGAFAPVVTDEYILSDGGMVRNIPVDVARELCADIVIVVNLVEPAANPAKLQSAISLISRSMDVMIQANETLQLKTLTARDIRIDVPMGDIGTADFERIPEAIPLGETAARVVADSLVQLAMSSAEYVAWRDRVTSDQAVEATVAAVRFEGLERVNPEYLDHRAEVQPGDTVNSEAISAEAQRMSAQQDIESVAYQLEGDPQQPTLVWLPKEKRWGPNYINFDLGLYTSTGDDLYFNLYAKHTRTWLNHLGAEWRNEIQFGYESLVSSSVYQPLTVSQKYFVEPKLGWLLTIENIYEDGDRLARYSFNNYSAGIDFGVNLSHMAQIRLGYMYTQRETQIDLGSPLLPQETSDDAGLAISATYDSRDTPFSANEGMAFALEYLQSNESLGASRDWQRIEAGLGWAVPVPLRKDVVWLNLAGGSGLGSDLPWDRNFMIGGPVSFPGFELGEIRAEDYWIAAGSYLWEVKEISSIRNEALYLGFRLQAGETFDRIDLVDNDIVYGGSVYLSGRTPVGPLTVGVGTTSTDSWSLWLAVGRPVGHGTILERGIFR